MGSLHLDHFEWLRWTRGRSKSSTCLISATTIITTTTTTATVTVIVIVIVCRKLEPVDLQLPEQEYIQVNFPAVLEPKVKFKEKMLASLGNDEEGEVETGFKKRRLNCNPKRSMRQRLDQDD